MLILPEYSIRTSLLVDNEDTYLQTLLYTFSNYSTNRPLVNQGTFLWQPDEWNIENHETFQKYS